MTEPRERNAEEVADHAAAIVEEAQALVHGAFPGYPKVWGLIERLAAQVEDLAAELGRHQENPDLH